MKSIIASIRSWIKTKFWNLKFKIVNRLHPYKPEPPTDIPKQEPRCTPVKIVVAGESFEKLKETVASMRSSLIAVSEAASSARSAVNDMSNTLIPIKIAYVIGEIASGMTMSELAEFIGKLPIPQNKKREIFDLPPIEDESIFIIQSDVIQRAASEL